MEPIKCITFDKEAQDNLPQHIKDKMKLDRDNARKNKVCKKCLGLGFDPFPNNSTTPNICKDCNP